MNNTNTYHIAAYYFPNFHQDSRNALWHGPGWTEWNLLRAATPRFDGHQQPKIPLWGYEDEADPVVMAKKVQAARTHGLEAFVFDWYWYGDAPFLHRALEDGFLHAQDNSDFHFAIMWANHDWQELQPAIRGECLVREKGATDEASFRRATDYITTRYFSHPNYWRVNGGLYFSIYELHRLMEGLGGLENTKRVLDAFRQRVRDAGLGELHINAVVWGIQVLPGTQAVQNPEEVLTYLGIDSCTSYVWIHYLPTSDFPVTEYGTLRAAAKKANSEMAKRFPIPYFPNVTMGWDPSPRTIQTDVYEKIGYPFTEIFGGNTAAEFEKALGDAKEHLDTHPAAANTLIINAWNEWTEGSYLEPDTDSKYGYLEAIRNVFGAR